MTNNYGLPSKPKWQDITPDPSIFGKVVGITTFGDRLIAATEHGVFERVDNTFKPIKFEGRS